MNFYLCMKKKYSIYRILRLDIIKICENAPYFSNYRRIFLYKKGCGYLNKVLFYCAVLQKLQCELYILAFGGLLKMSVFINFRENLFEGGKEMRRCKFYLAGILVFLLVIGCLMPANVYASIPSRDADMPKSKESAFTVKAFSAMSSTGLVVNSDKSAEELAQMLVGDSVAISNIKYTGDPLAKGSFSGGADIIGFDEGIILSSGNVEDVVGPNSDDGISTNFETPGDVDLSNLIGGEETNDAAVLEFDFIPENNVISFTYVFASDEYNEYVYDFNDVFGFFVNGQNVALIPGTDIPVSIDNVNGGNPFGSDNAKNSAYYRNNDPSDGDAAINTEMDGLTTVLHVQASVISGKPNHIKLAVADAKDTSFDSVVFIKAESFDDKPIAHGDLAFELTDYYVDESTEAGYAEIFVVRNNGSDGQVTVGYETSDLSALSNIDYTPASGVLVFNDGETRKNFKVSIIDDNFIEGDEAIELSLTEATGGAELGEQKNATLTIKDDEGFRFTERDYTVSESVSKASITVEIVGIYESIEEPLYKVSSNEFSPVYDISSDTAISVDFFTVDGTATAGSDYVSTSGTLYFQPGETEKSFDVEVIEDNKYEGNETVLLSLSNPINGILGIPSEAVLTIIESQSKPSGGSKGESSKIIVPPTKKLSKGTLIDRMDGYIVLSEPLNINEVKSELRLTYDEKLLKNKPAHTPRVYYWNADKKNWVALATYPVNEGKVKAINDGKYKGWFVVFGVIQPGFSDVKGNWADEIINRMNGLGMVEGYPSGDESMLRAVLPNQKVSRAEFTMLISRILNLDIDDPKLPLISEEKSLTVLKESFTDYDKIPKWVIQAAGTLCKEKMLPQNGSDFLADKSITRIEAAVMISNAMKILTNTKAADLSKFTDSDEIADWVKGELVEGAMLGYPDGTFKPNENLTRAEAITLLYRLFIEGMGW